MKRIFIALAAAAALTACDSGPGASLGSAAKLAAGVESEFTINVDGTPGSPFSGGYMVIQASGQNTQKSVDGAVPAQYQVKGMIVSAGFQKQREKGELIVTIMRDGKEVARADTQAAYGLANVATQ